MVIGEKATCEIRGNLKIIIIEVSMCISKCACLSTMIKVAASVFNMYKPDESINSFAPKDGR